MDMSQFWKSQTEIDEEERIAKEEELIKEQTPNPEERIAVLEETIMMLMMEG